MAGIARTYGIDLPALRKTLREVEYELPKKRSRHLSDEDLDWLVFQVLEMHPNAGAMLISLSTSSYFLIVYDLLFYCRAQNDVWLVS